MGGDGKREHRNGVAERPSDVEWNDQRRAKRQVSARQWSPALRHLTLNDSASVVNLVRGSCLPLRLTRILQVTFQRREWLPLEKDPVSYCYSFKGGRSITS